MFDSVTFPNYQAADILIFTSAKEEIIVVVWQWASEQMIKFWW